MPLVPSVHCEPPISGVPIKLDVADAVRERLGTTQRERTVCTQKNHDPHVKDGDCPVYTIGACCWC